MIISLYHSIDCLLDLAILVLPCVPDSPNIVTVATSVLAAGTAFSGIVYFIVDFIFYRNRNSKCVTR